MFCVIGQRTCIGYSVLGGFSVLSLKSVSEWYVCVFKNCISSVFTMHKDNKYI